MKPAEGHRDELLYSLYREDTFGLPTLHGCRSPPRDQETPNSGTTLHVSHLYRDPHPTGDPIHPNRLPTPGLLAAPVLTWYSSPPRGEHVSRLCSDQGGLPLPPLPRYLHSTSRLVEHLFDDPRLTVSCI